MYRLASALLMAKKIHKFSGTLTRLNEEAAAFIKSQKDRPLLTPDNEQTKKKSHSKSYIPTPAIKGITIKDCAAYIIKIKKRTRKLYHRCFEKDSTTTILSKIFHKKKDPKLEKRRKQALFKLSTSISVFEKRVLAMFKKYITDPKYIKQEKKKLHVLVRMDFMRVLLESKVVLERGLSIVGHNTGHGTLGNLEVYVNQAVIKLNALVSLVDFLYGQRKTAPLRK